MSSRAAAAAVKGGARVGRHGAEATCPPGTLVERAGRGDGRAFDRLLLETQERVVRLAWRLLGSREGARDVGQEVYLRVFRHLRRFRADWSVAEQFTKDSGRWMSRAAARPSRYPLDNLSRDSSATPPAAIGLPRSDGNVHQ